MTKRFLKALSVCLAMTICTSFAHAHFPWVKIDPTLGKQGTVLFYFEHAPKPGDGSYLDPFIERGQFWLTTADGESEKLSLDETKDAKLRWLQTELTAPAPRCVDSYTKWGVYRYGQTDTLLHYYARTVDAESAEDIAKLAESKHLDLQLQPKLIDGELSVRVTWQGKPLVGQEVALRSRTVARSYKTDDQGVVVIPIDAAGQFALRTKMVAEGSGEFDGKAYAEVHHHSTLVMNLRHPPR